jgi:hypothetical protein
MPHRPAAKPKHLPGGLAASPSASSVQAATPTDPAQRRTPSLHPRSRAPACRECRSPRQPAWHAMRCRETARAQYLFRHAFDRPRAAEDDDGDGLGHIAPKATGSRDRIHRTGCQRMVSDDDLARAQDKGARCAADLIGPCAALEPLIQCRGAGIEGLKLMVLGQRLRCAQVHARSHSAFVRMVRRKRSLG